MNTYHNVISGKETPARSGRTFEKRNPAVWEEVIGVFPLSAEDDVDEAVRAAAAAFERFRSLPAPERGRLVRAAGGILERRKREIAAVITRETGKVLTEAEGEVQEAIDTAYYAAGEGRRLFGRTTPSELNDKLNMAVRGPVGVAGIITPWNFPLAVPCWKLFPALVCGNTVVWKPAPDAPATADLLVHILAEAGLPAGTVNLVHGEGPGTGRALAAHPDVALVSFTGSVTAGKAVSRLAVDTLKRVSLELGGKNAQIVMDDADLELALEGIVWGAFGTSGQRCTSTSRLILHKKIHDDFMTRLLRRARALTVGNGLEPGVDVGPCITAAQRDRIQMWVEKGMSEGAKLICGGAPLAGKEYERGWFYPPTVLDNVTPSMSIAREEIFGPVLSVFKAASLEEAVVILNDTPYGLSSSVYTTDINNAFRAARDIEAGIVYVNGPTIGAETHLPFGGWKQSGNGRREGGWPVFDFYTEWKTVYVDFSGRLQRAQIDTASE